MLLTMGGGIYKEVCFAYLTLGGSGGRLHLKIFNLDLLRSLLVHFQVNIHYVLCCTVLC